MRKKLEKGIFEFICTIPKNTLNDNLYSIDVMVVENGPIVLHHIKEIINIEGVEIKRETSWLEKFPGMIRPQYFKWEKIKR